MYSLNVLMQLFDYKVNQLVKEKLELLLARGFAYAHPTHQPSRQYPLEYPIALLQDYLCLPENRGILLEFIRRYYRDEILQKSLQWLFAKKEDELRTHFSEISDLVDYIGAIRTEKRLSDFLIEYDSGIHLMPNIIPQKNYKDYIQLTGLLKNYAEEMQYAEAYAIYALFQNNTLNVTNVIDLIEKMKTVKEKTMPRDYVQKMGEKIAARYNTYHAVLAQVVSNAYATVQEIARTALMAMSYYDAIEPIEDSHVLATFTQFERGFKRFYLPILPHQERVAILEGILRSGTLGDGKWFVTAMLHEYGEQQELQEDIVPTIVLSADTFADAVQKIDEFKPNTLILHSDRALMKDIFEKYPKTFEKFYEKTDPADRGTILTSFYHFIKQPNRQISSDIVKMICHLSDLCENMVFSQSANNNSPVNNSNSPVSRPQ